MYKKITHSWIGKYTFSSHGIPVGILWCPILLMEEILHQLIGSLSHYFQGFIHPRWCRISSINSIFPSFWFFPLDWLVFLPPSFPPFASQGWTIGLGNFFIVIYAVTWLSSTSMAYQRTTSRQVTRLAPSGSFGGFCGDLGCVSKWGPTSKSSWQCLIFLVDLFWTNGFYLCLSN